MGTVNQNIPNISKQYIHNSFSLQNTDIVKPGTKKVFWIIFSIILTIAVIFTTLYFTGVFPKKKKTTAQTTAQTTFQSLVLSGNVSSELITLTGDTGVTGTTGDTSTTVDTGVIGNLGGDVIVFNRLSYPI